jgi:hypothetical protein
MENRDYLLCYGKAGDFGPFQAPQPLACRRGQRVVIRSQRGEELGVVMRPAVPGHAAFLAGQYVGRILRVAEETDLQLAERLRARSHNLFLDARRLAVERALPVEVLDAEILLDGRQGVLYCLKPPELESGPFVATLAKRTGLELCLRDLAVPPGEEVSGEPTGESGCGAPDCGAHSGGCGSCSSGGCSSCVLQHAVSRSAANPTHAPPL